MPERCFLLKVTANRSRLVRRDLREIFYLLRKQNRAFAPAHPICRKAYAGKVKGRAYKKVCPEKARPEYLRGQRRCRVPVGLSSNHGKFFRQLERIFVSEKTS